MFRYGQYCPVAKASEILGDRWTLLIAREIRFGTCRFSEFQRNLPGISRAVLADRLKRLEQTGVVERRTAPDGGKPEYHFTEAGRELRPILEAMGHWAARWILTDPAPQESDPDLLLLFLSRHVAVEKLPERRTIVEFEIAASRRRRRYWLVLDRPDVSLCLKPPGFDSDLVVRAEAKALYRVYLGRQEYARAVANEQIALEGPRALVRAFPKWMKWSHFADTARRAKQASA